MSTPKTKRQKEIDKELRKITPKVKLLTALEYNNNIARRKNHNE